MMKIERNAESWLNLNEKILKTSINEEIKIIFKKNLDLKNNDDFCDFFSLSINNMRNLAKTIFEGSQDFSNVLRIVLEFSKLALSLSPSNYINTCKMFMAMLKTNEELIQQEPSILELPVSYNCSNFTELFKKVNEKFDGNYYTFLIMQVRLITELQKCFGRNFRGSQFVVEAVVDIDNYSRNREMNEKLLELMKTLITALWSDLKSSFYYSTFFTRLQDPSKMESTLYFCNEVLEKIKENEEFRKTAMTNDKTTNFCLLTINFLAENYGIVQKCQQMFEDTIQSLSQVLCLTENSKFTESEIVKSMLNEENFWPGEVSLQVFMKYLKIIENKEEIAGKFVLFQKNLRAIWNPSTNLTTLTQLRIAKILVFIGKNFSEVAKNNMVDRKLMEILAEFAKKSCQENFNSSMDLIVSEPTKLNFYNLQLNLKTLAFINTELTKETQEKLCSLIKMIENCDLTVISDMVTNVIQVILKTPDNTQKLILLLKLNEALNSDKLKPFEVKLQLLELFFSFIPAAKTQIGVKKLLIRGFNKLLVEGPERLREMIVKKMQDDEVNWEIARSLEFNGLDSINYEDDDKMVFQVYESVKQQKTSHICKAISRSSKNSNSMTSKTSKHSKKLEMILKYFQTLESSQLSPADHKLLQQIQSTLKSYK